MKTLNPTVENSNDSQKKIPSWRIKIGEYRNSLKFIIPAIIVASSILSGSLFLFISYSALESDKIRDLNSLKHFQLQSVANYIKEEIVSAAALEKQSPEVDLYEISVGNMVFTMKKGTANRADIDIFVNQALKITPSQIIVLNGSSGNIAFINDEKFSTNWFVVTFDLRELISSVFPEKESGTSYVMNNLDEILFVSDPSKKHLINSSQAPIVSEGIRSNLNNFLMFGIDKNLQAFYAIPETNMLFILDQEKVGLLEATWHLRDKILHAGILSIVMLAIPLILIMSRLSNVFLQLSRTANEYSIGNFAYRASIKTKLLEVKQLISTVSSLGDAIIQRDLRIKRFFEKEKILVRTQAEIDLYDVIKKDFIKIDSELVTDNYKFDFLYLASNRFSGDVISVRSEQSTGSMISMLFDISGHGIASAFYSTALVGLIESHLKSNSVFDYPKLAQDISSVFFSLASGKMHVTAVCCIYNKDQHLATFYNSGHNPALLISSRDDSTDITRINIPSEPLGLSETPPRVTTKTFELEQSSSHQIFLYTDGLVEARNQKKIQFGSKRLRQALLLAAPRRSSKDTLTIVHEEMKKHVGQCEQEDDITALAIQIDCVSGVNTDRAS